MNIFEEMKLRGLVFQTTPEEPLKNLLTREKITFYIGFDPTAESLHIGNLLQIIAMKRFQNYGHKPIALVGGATGLIGDPSGKSQERNMNSEDVVNDWVQKIKNQLSRYLDFENVENKAIMVSNYEWISREGLIPYMRDIGKYFTVNEMIKRDSVKNRLEREDSGISYTEFSYMIFQAYDFWYLNQNFDCKLQIGGSDQWGNIISGVELIRKKEGREAFALTQPLITSSDGKKLGKTEKGAIWLDKMKTSPFQFYQFWLNVDDKDAVRFMKYFTFLTLAEIVQIEIEHNLNTSERIAQKRLAEEVTKFVHGEEELSRAISITKFLFENEEFGSIKEETFDLVFQTMDDESKFEINTDDLIDMLIDSNLATSKKNARELISSGGIYLNNRRIEDVDLNINSLNLLFGKYLVARKGKKTFKIGKLR